ncbi:MAG TPA: tRNA (guanosine(37)-N1)-methyltransferase TrmD [Balneola sp.]|jgi:tRNA (guanine37-N1)-methyltransferase|nr:tRNA (guanosine(37)-N1)-methyltransferase TrmD [Balneola sp.]MAO76655.1 tRNA (guanosine(37)-N1)-methyltransferase TrmD [Balneola sp.]MBF65062.1 tRNA (guanosine(37)-N1)-methyltransferase TrmD [Balneola sp.]HBZ37638.1 tRNA (guanosine(37)-N1)-methyltransferase TrmD [Balneola sp.]|tara:strand:- start:8845 stop:9537 length:693 start_codon:yes stop_codon:yes gene_type:complete
MRIDIISAVPKLLTGPLENSIVNRAKERGLVEIFIHDLRDFTEDKHNKIDDYPYGGDAGMVLTPQPIFSCIEHLTSERKYDEIIFTAPDGEQFNQSEANRLSLKENVMILCGHYKGIDQRVRDVLITKEYTIGDYVLSGGELPAMVITDALVRLIPNVIGDAGSALSDSFQNGLLEAPVYTRPAEFKGLEVPKILCSGDHKKIEAWKTEQSLKRTKERRKDLYEKFKKDY